MQDDELVEAWRSNCRINAILIDSITPKGMQCTLSTRGGRGVAGEFAHMHNLRAAQIERRARALDAQLVKFQTKVHPTKAQLRKAFAASDKAVEQLLVGVLHGAPGFRGFRKGIFTTLSYFVSHEAHHRGRILLTLKVSGQTLDRVTQMRIWGWDQL